MTNNILNNSFIIFIERQRMGQVQTQTKIEQQYDIVKLREDGSALLQHKNNQDEFLLRTVASNIGEQLKCFEDILRKRQQVKSPHLLDLIQIRKKEEKNVCSVVHKMYLLIEFPFKTLKDEIMDKIAHAKVVPFLEAELWSILYSCCMGLNVLYSKKMPHQCLASSQIYINREGLIKISDPILLGLQKNYIKVLKNSEEHVHISPEVISFLDDCNFSFYDKQKSDIFVLAVIMLEASLLRTLHLFDRQTKKPYLDIIPMAINELRQKYSPSYCEILQKMLQLHSKLRPKFADIISLIQKDNSLYQSTDQTTFQQFNQTGQSASNTKNSKSQKTLPKASWSNVRVDKRQTVGASNPKQKTMVRVNNSNPKIGSNQPHVYKDETIIKMLQTQNFQNSSVSKNYLPSQTPPPIYMPINQPQFIFHQHPAIVQQPMMLPGYKLSPSVHSSGFPVNNNINFDPSRFNQGERFSYTKFGNIVLNNPQKQKPIFSYDIPEINQILKSHLTAKGGQPFNQNQARTPERKQQMPQNKPNSFIRPQNISISPVRVFQQSKLADQLRRPINPEITQIQEKKQQPQKPTFENQIYLNLNFVQTEVKETPKARQKNLKPFQNSKISLNAKKNQIFSVTQKSEESLETSPAKITSNNSSIKIKEPQKSPGVQFSNHLQTPSNHKEIRSPHTEEGEKYVILMLEGGGRYEGYMRNGMKNGQGKLQFNDGGYYVGEWRDNKMHGFGKLHYQNGQVAYEGNWEDDQFCGFGRVFNDRPEKLIGTFNFHDFADINEKWIYYEGEFRNDSKHGKGKLRLTNGEVFEGNFVFDSIEGEGTFYTCKGEQVRGFWRDNMLITQ